jgi:hypothetical protein
MEAARKSIANLERQHIESRSAGLSLNKIESIDQWRRQSSPVQIKETPNKTAALPARVRPHAMPIATRISTSRLSSPQKASYPVNTVVSNNVRARSPCKITGVGHTASPSKWRYVREDAFVSMVSTKSCEQVCAVCLNFGV